MLHVLYDRTPGLEVRGFVIIELMLPAIKKQSTVSGQRVVHSMREEEKTHS